MKNLTQAILPFFLFAIVLSDLDDDKKAEVTSKNPEAQFEINKLKKEFYNSREAIHEDYEIKIRELKKSRKIEINSLRKKYRKRLKRLQKKYPSIPKDIILDPKPKPKLMPPKFKNKENIENDSKSMRKRNKNKSIQDSDINQDLQLEK